jgi:DNA-binding FrmR family transcriptional regulator
MHPGYVWGKDRKSTMATVPERAEGDIQVRLRRIEGQIRGIIGMLADGKSCEQVVTQILAARAAMDGVAMEVLKCQITEALSTGYEQSPDEARESVLRAVALLARVQG